MLRINQEIAERFEEVATLLREQGANPYRVRAYERAAGSLRRLKRSVADVHEAEGLEALPAVGESLARAIRLILRHGRLPILDRLRGEIDPVALLATVPGLGETLAQRLHDELGIDTLEELETAAHDGRLERFEGIGPKRLTAVRDTLDHRLHRVRPERRTGPADDEPPVSEILDVDREYRERAETAELPHVAPKRFNESGEAWLPILHATRGDRHYTALFSNTRRAHEQGKTRDWVVIYCDSDTREQQWTVVTARRGALAGKRVVRGREHECLALEVDRPETDAS